MSTSWGYKCTSCADEYSPTWFNTSRCDLLVAMIPLAEHFSAILFNIVYSDWISEETMLMRIYDHPTPERWLANHKGHDIVVVNEYGDIYESK